VQGGLRAHPALLARLYIPVSLLRALWVVQCFWARACRAGVTALRVREARATGRPPPDPAVPQPLPWEPQTARGCLVLVDWGQGLRLRRVERMEALGE
jgi:hypothetical protein